MTGQIAVAEQALGRWVEAERHLLEALHAGDPWVENNRPQLEASLESVREHLGSLWIVCATPNAVLSLNGSVVGSLPAGPIRLTVGEVRVVLEAPGFARSERLVAVAPGQSKRLELELVRIDAAGDEAGSNALPPAASHSPPTVPPAARQSTIPWVLAIGAGVLLSDAAIAHVVGLRLASQYNDDSRCLHGDMSREERCGSFRTEAETMRNVAIAGYAVGGAAAVTAAWLLLKNRPGVSVGLTPNGFGAGYAATF